MSLVSKSEPPKNQPKRGCSQLRGLAERRPRLWGDLGLRAGAAPPAQGAEPARIHAECTRLVPNGAP